MAKKLLFFDETANWKVKFNNNNLAVISPASLISSFFISSFYSIS